MKNVVLLISLFSLGLVQENFAGSILQSNIEVFTHVKILDQDLFENQTHVLPVYEVSSENIFNPSKVIKPTKLSTSEVIIQYQKITESELLTSNELVPYQKTVSEEIQEGQQIIEAVGVNECFPIEVNTTVDQTSAAQKNWNKCSIKVDEIKL